jgi:hypothetical protein
MLPDATFKRAIQNVPEDGDIAKTMGAYFPRASYGSKAAFERRGCRR